MGVFVFDAYVNVFMRFVIYDSTCFNLFQIYDHALF